MSQRDSKAGSPWREAVSIQFSTQILGFSGMPGW